MRKRLFLRSKNVFLKKCLKGHNRMMSQKITPSGCKKSHYRMPPFALLVWKQFFAGWYAPSLTLIVLLAVCLNFWQLGHNGYSNLYYAAAVRSMGDNWHNFFFASFDPAGFVSIDKPPVDFWVQVLSAKLFGFHPWSLLLPQALAGVLSVALLAHLVRRRFGGLAGLLAALALTLTPISVITSRNNDVDSMLVLVILLAAWVVIIATEQGSIRWLLVSMGLVGLGFNIKMAEAYLVVPAFVLLYFLTAPRSWRTRIGHLALASGILLAISLSWLIVVDLTPTTQRPYVGSSGNNTELRLAFGYNGISRVFGHHLTLPLVGTLIGTTAPARAVPVPHVAPPPQRGPNGLPGPLRLFNQEVAGQISWLLPLALIGMLVLLWRKHPRPLHNTHVQGLVLWGGWFLTAATFFSFTGSFQMYYMVMFAPAICALVGIGLATLWQEYLTRGRRGWLLPVAVGLTAIVQLSFLSPFPAWRQSWLTPLLFSVLLIVAPGLLILPVWRRDNFSRLSAPLLAAGFLVLLLAPAIWTALPVIQNRNSAFPIAGPYETTTPSPASTDLLTTPALPIKPLAQNTLSGPDFRLLHFLSDHEGTARYLYATTSSSYADPVIIQTGKAVMTMGGFAGADHILTVSQLVTLVQQHSVRYFLLPETIPSPLAGINDWVKSACLRLLPSTWYSTTVLPQGAWIARLRLYDCGNPHPFKSKPVASSSHRDHSRHTHTRSSTSALHRSRSFP